MTPSPTLGLRIWMVTLAVVLSSCAQTETLIIDRQPIVVSPASSEAAPSAGIPQKIRLAEPHAMQTMDPLFVRNESAQRTIGLIYQGLVTYDADGNVIPALAQSWEIDEENLVYTFRLNPAATFQDSPRFVDGRGRRVTAQDVAHAFQRMTNPAVPEDAVRHFAPLIAGMDAFNREQRQLYFPAERSMTAIQGIQIVDGQTIRFILNSPSSEFLHLLASPIAFIYPRELSESLTDYPLGSGPYKLVRTSGDSLVVLQYNPAFWSAGTQQQHPQTVEIRYFSTEASIVPAISRGVVDLMANVPPAVRRSMYQSPLQLNAELFGDFSIRETTGTVYTLRMNSQNAVRLQPGSAPVILNAFAIDSLRNDVVFTGIQFGSMPEVRNSGEMRELVSELAQLQPLLTLAFSDSRAEGYLARNILRRINPDLRVSLVRSGVVSREITWHFRAESNFGVARGNDVRVNDTEQWLHPQSDELLRMHVPRHVLVHNQVVGLQLNEYPWWLNLQGVRLVAAE
jgi:hypothetical protein